MSFVAITDIRPFVFPCIFEAIQDEISEGKSYFEAIVPKADLIIKGATGVPIPEGPDDAPEDLIVPAAYIIQKLASGLIQGETEDFYRKVNSDYQEGLKLMANRIQDGTEETQDKSNSFTTKIEGLNVW